MHIFPKYSTRWGMFFVNILIFIPFVTLAQTDPFDPQNQIPSKLEKEVFRILDQTKKDGKIATGFSQYDSYQLPLIFSKNPNWLIGIDSVTFQDGRGLFSVIASVNLPGTKRKLAFQASGIDLNPNGISPSSSSRLYLVSDAYIPINENLILYLPGDQTNFIEISCQGFSGIRLKGSLIFKDNIIQPEPDLNKVDTKYVRASLDVYTSDLHNILIGVEISPFQISGLAGLGFEIKKAYLDMSDVANPPGIRFPPTYYSEFSDHPNLWRGIYVEEVNVLLPEEFLSKTGRYQVGARELIIDRLGLSGDFTIQKGELEPDAVLGNWPCHLEGLSLRLVHNKLVGGSLLGKLGVPFLNKEKVSFQAEFEQIQGKLNLRFALLLDTSKEYDTPFGAKIYLDPGSRIGFESRNGKLTPQMVLHGRMELAHDILKLKNIRFENLTIIGASPYLLGGVFSLGGEEPVQLSHFRGSTNEIRLEVFQGNFALTLPLRLNLMNAQDKGFSAETLVRVAFSVKEVPQTYGDKEITRQAWKLDKIKVEEIYLETRTGAIALEGKLAFRRNDPVYGNGFYGNIKLQVNDIFKKGVQAQAQFGSKPSYRYWQVDFNAPLKNIPLGTGTCYINGIMGGASYHMISPSYSRFNYNLLNQPTSQTSQGLETYVPDSSSSLELKAGVTLILAQETVFNADALFRMNFRKGGGLKEIYFNGNAYFFTPLPKRVRSMAPDKSAPAYANLRLFYDFENRIFHANCQTYLQVNGVMSGTGPNGLVGEAVLHFSPQDWYMYIGRPRQMLGVDLFRVLNTKAYFMIGTQVEDLPVPPPALQDIFGDIDLDFMRDENALSSGRGFAAGLHVQASANPRLGPFYARLRVGGGVDLMLRRYHLAYCKNRQDKQLGIKGWYGSGQAYVFLDGSVGVKLGRRKSFDFLRLGAGALLQAKLPNPTWMRGVLAGRFSILGGLVKGKFRLKLTIGEECELVQEGNELGDVLVIGDIQPEAGGQDVSVFTAPQIAFNMPIDRTLTLMNNYGEVSRYRVIMDDLSISHNGEKLAGEILWNEAKDLATLETNEILPENSNLSIYVKLHWEKYESGGWKPLEYLGKIEYESKTFQFTTGTAPSFIPKENIAYSYPLINQYNFYPQEYPHGYIQLKQGQSNLFYASDSLGNWRYEIRFWKTDSSYLKTPLLYTPSEARINFDLPPVLEPETLYTIELVRLPADSSKSNKNISRDYTNTKILNEDAHVRVSSNSLIEGVARQEAFELLRYHVRSSKYQSFLKKIEGLKQVQDVKSISPSNTRLLGKIAKTEEVWDQAELVGTQNLPPLVSLEAQVEVTWINQLIAPWIYEEHPFEPGISISDWRSPQNYLNPIPLSEGVSLDNFKPTNQVLNFQRQVQLSRNVPSQAGDMYILYNLSHFAYQDFYELRNKAFAFLIRNNMVPSPKIKRLLGLDPNYPDSFVDLQPGEYPLRLEYKLPGSNHVTSTHITTIKY